MKGKKGSSCNLTACQRPHSAVFYNKSTQKYYCYDCSRQINWRGGRPYVKKLYGTDYLCELDVEALSMLQDGAYKETLKGKTSQELFGA